jgi:putative glutamine amidotransferase
VIKIGISRCVAFADYELWVKKAYPPAEVVELSYQFNDPDDLKGCDGLILTGGGDVDSKLYGKDDLSALCKGVDNLRDDFELRLVDVALREGKPVFGICRGLQIVNVALGGTLVLDIEKRGGNSHTKLAGLDRWHEVRVESDSELHTIAKVDTSLVNSSHHQAADSVGDGLIASAKSLGDGIKEALEWREKTRIPFLALVQWHPERITDTRNVFSLGLLEKFLKEAENSNR